MRLALLATASSFAIVGALFACSNGPPEASADSDAGDPSSDNNSAPSNGDNPPPPDTTASNPIPDSDAAVDPDADVDGGVVVTTTGDGDAGLKCLPGSIPEVESNNTVATATALPAATSTFCGRLTVGDVDWFTFTMPQNVAHFGFQIQSFSGGNLTIQPSLDGNPFSFNGTYPFEAGGVYTLKLTSTSTTNNVDYRISVEIDQ